MGEHLGPTVLTGAATCPAGDRRRERRGAGWRGSGGPEEGRDEPGRDHDHACPRRRWASPKSWTRSRRGPGVYQHKDAAGTVLYVGKAKNLRNRVRQYFQKSRSMGPRIEQMLSRATDLEVIVTDSEVEALILESNLIKKLKPRYNVTLKDDKSYPYIVITNEPFPRVFVTRQVRKDGSQYFGPYTDVKNVRAALKAVRDIFPVRSCNYFIDDESIRKRKVKVCLDYHIKKCEGPCEGLVSQERYGAMIDQVASLLRGRTESLIAKLSEEMEREARSAPVRGGGDPARPDQGAAGVQRAAEGVQPGCRRPGHPRGGRRRRRCLRRDLQAPGREDDRPAPLLYGERGSAGRAGDRRIARAAVLP